MDRSKCSRAVERNGRLGGGLLPLSFSSIQNEMRAEEPPYALDEYSCFLLPAARNMITTIIPEAIWIQPQLFDETLTPPGPSIYFYVASFFSATVQQKDSLTGFIVTFFI